MEFRHPDPPAPACDGNGQPAQWLTLRAFPTWGRDWHCGLCNQWANLGHLAGQKHRNNIAWLTKQSPQAIDWQQQQAPPAPQQQLDDVLDDAATSWAGVQDGGLVSDAEAESNYDEIDRKDPPIFINNTRIKVVVAAGKTATLECRVQNLGDRTVRNLCI